MISLQERVHDVARPDDWGSSKLHKILRVKRGNKNTGMVENNLLSLSYGKIVRKDITSGQGLLPESFETYQVVEPGNIVMRLTDLQNDKRSLRQGLVEERGIITSAYDALEVAQDHDPRFWFYTLLSLDLAKYYYSMGGGVRQSVKFSDFPDEWVSAPSLENQKAIADFLDRKTSRIDHLVDNKKLLMKRVAEMCDIEISEALSGDRSSQVGRYIPLKHTANFLNGLAFKPEDWSDAGLPIIRIAQMSGSAFDNFYTGEFDQRRYVENGDLLFSWSASIDAMIWSRGPGILNQHIFKVIPKSGFSKEFLHYSIKHHAPKWADVDAHGSTMKHLKKRSLSNPIWMPCENEQRSIAKILDERLSSLSRTMDMTAKSIDKLKDYRFSLIAAAVTGQLDVATRKNGKTDPEEPVPELDEVLA